MQHLTGFHCQQFQFYTQKNVFGPEHIINGISVDLLSHVKVCILIVGGTRYITKCDATIQWGKSTLFTCSI